MAKIKKKLFSHKSFYVNDEGKKFGLYDNIEILESGDVRVYQNGLCGMLKPDGTQVVPCKYGFVLEPKYGYYIVSSGVLRGILNSEGNLIGEFRNQEVKIYNEDFVKIGKYAVNATKKYGDDWDFENDHFIVSKDGKWGVISKDGKEVIPFIYDKIKIGMGGAGLAVQKNGKWGLAYYTGVFVTPCKYEEAPYLCGEGLIAVKQDGKYGLVDQRGNEVVTPKYKDIHYFNKGGAKVVAFESAGASGWAYGLIDKNGNEVVPCKYYDVYSLNEHFACVQDGPKGSLMDEKWVYSKRTGEKIGGRSESIYESNGNIICADLGNNGYFTIMDGFTGDYVDHVDKKGLKKYEKPKDISVEC